MHLWCQHHDTINKFTAVVNNKWRITIFPETCIDCSVTNDELATVSTTPWGKLSAGVTDTGNQH
jgi:hypothetical protein